MIAIGVGYPQGAGSQDCGLPWERSWRTAKGRWGSPAKPARRAAKSGERRPGRRLRRYSALWRTPVAPCLFRRGCGQKWELPAADVATSGALFRGSTLQTDPSRHEITILPHLGGQTVWNRTLQRKKPGRNQVDSPITPPLEPYEPVRNSPFIRPHWPFQSFEAFRTARFCPSVTTSLHFPLTLESHVIR